MNASRTAVVTIALTLSVSAMAAEGLRPQAQPPPAQRPWDDPARADPFRSDPILAFRWGPGDPTLSVSQLRIELGRPKDKSPATSGDTDCRAPQRCFDPDTPPELLR